VLHTGELRVTGDAAEGLGAPGEGKKPFSLALILGPGMVERGYNPSTLEAEAGKSGVGLHREIRPQLFIFLNLGLSLVLGPKPRASCVLSTCSVAGPPRPSVALVVGSAVCGEVGRTEGQAPPESRL
jgi:hypothetical protein